MIIKQGEFMSFAPAELHSQKPERTASHGRSVQRERTPSDATQSKPDLLRELERLVRENERLTLERDQLREELSRQSLEARRAQRIRQMQEETHEAPAPEKASPATIENLRRKPLTTTSLPDADEKSAMPLESTDPGYELARVVVKWFWEDADEASVRLVHDALLGQGIRTIVRDADEDDA